MAKQKKLDDVVSPVNSQNSLFDLIEKTPKSESPEERIRAAYTSYSIDQLAEEIKHHDALYEMGKPEISDALYDRLRLRLKDLAPDHPVLQMLFEQSADEVATALNPQTSQSASNVRTGSRASKSGKNKVVHQVAMLSLDKAYSAEEVLNWARDIESDLVASPKLDGLSCSLRYDQNGDLLIASTRGNGTEGDDITANVRYIDDIPKHIPAANLEVRGEVYMPISSFKRFGEAVMSPRNLAVGGLKQKDPAETAHYGLSFFGYELIGENHATEIEKLRRIKELGFKPVQHALIEQGSCNTLELIDTYIQNMLSERSEWDFEADGLVFKTNSVAEQKKHGFTAHHPKYSIAFKFQGDEGETVLRQVEWQVAKSGIITPVGNFDTIVLSGAAIQRATLVHAQHVEQFPCDNGFTHLKVGDRVLVSRRGGVIPCLERVVSEPDDAVDVVIPHLCPSCGAPTIRKELYLMCSDPDNCPSTGQALIENHTKVINCLGFGEKIIEALYDGKYVSTPADLYRLSVANIAMAIAEAKADKGPVDIDTSAVMPQKLYDSIQSSRRMSLAQFLESLSIPNLGREMSRDLQKMFGTLDALLAATLEEMCEKIYSGKKKASSDPAALKRSAVTYYNKIHANAPNDAETAEAWLARCVIPKTKRQHLLALIDVFKTTDAIQEASVEAIAQCLDAGQRPEYGKKAQSIHKGLIQRRALIDDLRQYVTIEETPNAGTQATTGPFANMSFLFTGSLESMKREDAQKRVEALGGVAASSVTKTLNVLVATNNTSTKWKKAESLNASGSANIQLWTEETFVAELAKAEAASQSGENK